MLVNVAQGPVIHPCRREVGDCARAVRRVLRLAAGIAMQHADMQSQSVASPEAQGEIFGHVAACVADAVDLRPRLAVDHGGMRFHIVRSEDDQVAGQTGGHRPAVQRIVIAVRDENANAGFSEPLYSAQESQLSAHAAAGAIVDIAGEDDEGGLALDSHPHERVESFERGVAQPRGDLRRHTSDHGERRVQMKIGGMDETEGRHLMRCTS